MAFLLRGIATINGVPTNGLQVVAYAESRFGAAPVLGSPFPDMSAADAGPVTSSEAFGDVGRWQLSVPTAGNYYVGWYGIGDPNQIITWSGTEMATPHTSLQGWTAGAVTGTNLPGTTITVGSNGVALPTATINVTSTTAPQAFANSGLLLIQVGTGVFTVVAYTGKTGTTFTGCTGGSGTLATNVLVAQAYQNGSYRRLVYGNLAFHTAANTDAAKANFYATINGTILFIGDVGITVAPTVAFTLECQAGMPVDPLGYYAFYPGLTGSGTANLTQITTVDF